MDLESLALKVSVWFDRMRSAISKGTASITGHQQSRFPICVMIVSNKLQHCLLCTSVIKHREMSTHLKTTSGCPFYQATCENVDEGQMGLSRYLQVMLHWQCCRDGGQRLSVPYSVSWWASSTASGRKQDLRAEGTRLDCWARIPETVWWSGDFAWEGMEVKRSQPLPRGKHVPAEDISCTRCPHL